MRALPKVALIVGVLAAAAILILTFFKYGQPLPQQKTVAQTPNVSPPKTDSPISLADLANQTSISPSVAAAMFDRLYARGKACVPEIRNLLKSGKNFPIKFASAARGKKPAWTQFPTLRTALLALLGEIGGDEVTACVLEVAHSTRDPLELALAGRVLEEQQPDQHREALVKAARSLLAERPNDPAPIFTLLALYGVPDVAADIERLAMDNPGCMPDAIAALTSLRQQGGDASLLNLWRRSDLSPDARSRLAYALGVTAPDSEAVQTELQRIFANVVVDPQHKCLVLDGVAGGDSHSDARLVPRKETVMVLPDSDWLMARLAILDKLQPATQDATVTTHLQKVRDDLLDELDKSQ